MKLSPLFMEIWSFETIHCLNFNTQRQKRYDVTNDVRANFLILRICRVHDKYAISANILFYILSMCAMEFAEKLTLIHFCPKFA